VQYPEVIQVLVQPAAAGVYPDRPQSPRLTDKRLAPIKQTQQQEKPKAYVPPHLRNRLSQDRPADLMKQSRENSGPRRLVGLEAQLKSTPVDLIPGAPPPVLQNPKTKKKRERRKAKNKEAKEKEKKDKSNPSQEQEDWNRL